MLEFFKLNGIAKIEETSLSVHLENFPFKLQIEELVETVLVLCVVFSL